MKTLKHILWAFLAAAVFAGCSDDPTYTPGTGEDPDNYGVYFPDQTVSTEVERDPADEATATFKVRRSKFIEAITVPVEITTSEEGILDIEPITFGPGEQETEFKVSFSKAVEGTKYTCNMRITDPKYISLYGPRATELSFSVIRAGWELVTNGEHTKGKWRDDLLGNIYSISSATFNPYPEIEMEIYQRKDMPGYYRMKVYGQELVNALAGTPVSFQGRNLYTIVDARNPEKVFIPYQSTGLALSTSEGEMKIASDVPDNFMMDESAGQYGTLENGIISFPAQSVLVEFEKQAGSFFHANRNGMLRILLPGTVVPDYTVTLAKTESANGIVDIMATLADDVRIMKISVFEGVLDDGQASLAAQEMDETDNFDSEIEESGIIRIENRTTGKYTLVGCIYDKENAMRDYVYISFGYIAKGDEKPVILTMGLESTNEFAGQGITSDNSAKFYAFGEEIESVTYGLFRTDRLGATDRNALLDAKGTKFDAEQLAALNAGHFSSMITGLNGDSNYTLLLRADNGYVRKMLEATYQTTGTYNPAMETFEYSDFLPVGQQPTLDYLKSTTWNYYAINYADGTSNPLRRKIGQVTMTDNPQQSSAVQSVVDITGLSGVEFDSGGEIMGIYMPGSNQFSNANGALALYTNRDMTKGVYQGQTAMMGFVAEEEGTNVYFGACMFMGAVDDGYLYCVPSLVGIEQNLTFRYFYTGTSIGICSLMGEMMLVDPAKEIGGLSDAALERIAALRKLALGNVTPRNFVELPQFSGATGYAAPVGIRMPDNLVTKTLPASAPRVKRAEASITVAPAPAAATTSTSEWLRHQGAAIEKSVK